MKKTIFFLLLCALIKLNSCLATKYDYCDRDEKTGKCKNVQPTEEAIDEDENDDEPMWEEEGPVEEEKPITKKNEKERKRREEDEAYGSWEKLTRLNGVKKGHIQEFTIDGFKFKLITRSMKPLLFEIPKAVSDDECEIIKERGANKDNSGGLKKSIARGGLTPEDHFKPSTEKGKAYGAPAFWENWDLNKDDVISLQEFTDFAQNHNYLYMSTDDAKKTLKQMEITEWDDGNCTKVEFETLNTRGIEDTLQTYQRDHPQHRQRTSDQAWVPLAQEFDPILYNIRERFGKLLKIPRKILHGSEHMQIVRYQPGGHYHSHHDSETEAATEPCCHLTNTNTILKNGRCKLCRFITIMTYLNDPFDGGETAFPAADNITYTESAFRRRPTNDKNAIDLYNLSQHCYDANLVVRPIKGTAVLWYNHHVDKSGWMGKLDNWSLHGGCDVRKGEKWIANIWITAPYEADKDKLSMYHWDFLDKLDFDGGMGGFL